MIDASAHGRIACPAATIEQTTGFIAKGSLETPPAVRAHRSNRLAGGEIRRR